MRHVRNKTFNTKEWISSVWNVIVKQLDYTFYLCKKSLKGTGHSIKVKWTSFWFNPDSKQYIPIFQQPKVPSTAKTFLVSILYLYKITQKLFIFWCFFNYW